MNHNVEHLRAQDCPELIAFLDKVFTEQNRMPMDFAALLPRILQPKDENMGWYYAIREKEKICAVAASHPLEYQLGNVKMHIAEVGSVAVDSSCRNRGMMQAVLNCMLEEVSVQDVDMLYLMGKRKRYQNFGFERCGTEYIITIASSMPNPVPQVNYTFRDLREEKEEVIDLMLAICEEQISGIRRSREGFLPALYAKHQQPLGILNEEGEWVGYLTGNSKIGSIGEICLKKTTDFGSVIGAYLSYAQIDKVTLRLPEYEHDRLREAFRIADRYQINPPGMFRILNFEKVVKAYLQIKQTYAYMPEGNLVLDTELFGRWSICIRNGQVHMEASEKEPDIILQGFDIYSFLFGPASPELDKNISQEVAFLVKCWFPMPLFGPQLT